MNEKILTYINKADEYYKKGDFKKALKYISISAKYARYDGVDSIILEEITNRKKKIMEKMFIPLPKFFNNIYIWFIGLIFSIILIYFSLIFYFPLSDIFFLLSIILFLSTTHPFSHYLIASISKIKIVGVCLGGPLKLQPTLIVDYSTYFSSEKINRIVFHLIGPLSTIITSLFLMILTFIFNFSEYLRIVTLLLFIITLITNLLFSVKFSDLKKALNERKYDKINIKWLK